MDFNIEQVKNDIFQARDILEKQGITDDFELIGSGGNGCVFKFNTAALKVPTNGTLGNIPELIDMGRQGVEKKVHFAPILGDMEFNDEQCAFFPFLKGPTLGKARLDTIVQIGSDGFEKYFNDISALRQIGFGLDSYEQNYIITGKDKKRISMIDLSRENYVYPTDPETLTWAHETKRACDIGTLVYTMTRLDSRRKETDSRSMGLKAEIYDQIHTAVSRVSYNKDALKYLENNEHNFLQR